MTIGLSTYAYFWRSSERAVTPMTLPDMVADTAAQGVGVFQICDYPAVAEMDDGALEALRRQAERGGVRLELGTRGLAPTHLATYLELARRLDAVLVRSMVNTATHQPTMAEAASLLGTVAGGYERAGVRIALETYEQVSSADLVDLVRTVDSPAVGICSDPANCVAALELPGDVIDRVAPYVMNMHIKDFRFTRQDGWVGFSLVGAPLGEGLLDYRGMIERIDPAARGLSQIIEHWLPWQGTPEATCALEQQWTDHNLSYLRSAS